uniref:Uncharacterized protein n=1 Tax=Oryza meridionalis TaxID=40149 RepID=A0A0E0EHC6_9ORYZ
MTQPASEGDGWGCSPVVEETREPATVICGEPTAVVAAAYPTGSGGGEGSAAAAASPPAGSGRWEVAAADAREPRHLLLPPLPPLPSCC